jgi:uncharacterized protein YneF (UPF0154 family)
MIRPRAGLAVLLMLLALTAGCRSLIGAMGYYLHPRQIQKPEYEFPAKTRLAMLIDNARPAEENPMFNQALLERVVEMLRDGGAKAEVMPLQAINDLRRANPDFGQWSVQKIGRTLQADQVLHVKLDRLVIRESPDYPVLTPTVDLHMKLVAVNQPATTARLWPKAKEGHAVHCTRQTADSSGADADDLEATKLGHDTAYYVAMPFIEVDLEENPPVER